MAGAVFLHVYALLLPSVAGGGGGGGGYENETVGATGVTWPAQVRAGWGWAFHVRAGRWSFFLLLLAMVMLRADRASFVHHQLPVFPPALCTVRFSPTSCRRLAIVTPHPLLPPRPLPTPRPL